MYMMMIMVLKLLLLNKMVMCTRNIIEWWIISRLTNTLSMHLIITFRKVMREFAKGPAQHQNICPEVLARADDHPLCLKNVRSWIKSTKEQITALRGEVRRDVKGSKAKLHSKEGYVRNMQHYLKHGDWIDNFYGEYEEKKVQWVTIKPSGAM